jgi:hypothetical protein
VGFGRGDQEGTDCLPAADVCRLAATLRNILPGDALHTPGLACLERY